MTIRELVELVNKAESFNLQDKLNIKRYISITDKRSIAMDVIAACTDDALGFIEVDRFKAGIYFDMCVLQKYTSLEVSFDFEEMIKEYDMLNEIGMMNVIIDYFKDDYNKCQDVLNGELESFLAQNSLEAQVVTVVNKVNSLLDEIGAKFNDVNLNDIITNGVNLGELMETIKFLK